MPSALAASLRSRGRLQMPSSRSSRASIRAPLASMTPTRQGLQARRLRRHLSTAALASLRRKCPTIAALSAAMEYRLRTAPSARRRRGLRTTFAVAP
eukprot:scaffold870_cov268-Pinguiococcus_pyrenoidosus.AAC.28